MGVPIGKPTMQLEGLGLCEHCNALVTLEGMPAEAIDAELKCPGCRNTLGHKSFGYASEQGGKVQWVGPGGKWVTEKPAKDYELPDAYVEVQHFPRPWL